MNKIIVKRIISVILCSVVFILSSGCGDSKSNDNTSNEIEDAEATKSTETTTQSTVTTQAKPTDKLVALTFDDGPYSPVTDKILDTLEKYGATATFFVVGNRVEQYSESVKRAYDIGCEIGSHTYTHKNLTKLNAGAIKDEIDKSNVAIKKVTGHDITVVRPPEGAVNDKVRKNVQYPLAMWSVDSEDWRNKDLTKNYNGVMNSVFDGSIVLMHDLYPATAQAVEKIVPALIAQGYKFVTFSELMELREVKTEIGKRYFSAKPPEPETTCITSSSVNVTDTK